MDFGFHSNRHNVICNHSGYELSKKERKNTIFLRYKKNECSQKWVKARLYMIGYGIEKNYFEYAAF